MSKTGASVSVLILGLSLHLAPGLQAQDGFVDLFPNEGVPAGWSVREWNDLRKPVKEGGGEPLVGAVYRIDGVGDENPLVAGRDKRV